MLAIKVSNPYTYFVVQWYSPPDLICKINENKVFFQIGVPRFSFEFLRSFFEFSRQVLEFLTLTFEFLRLTFEFPRLTFEFLRWGFEFLGRTFEILVVVKKYTLYLVANFFQDYLDFFSGGAPACHTSQQLNIWN